MYPSKEQVSCFYCEWVGRRDKSKDHWKSQHPNENYKLKISENNLEKLESINSTVVKAVFRMLTNAS